MIVENSKTQDENLDIKILLERYNSAKKYRDVWNKLWEDCYDYALPQRGGFNGDIGIGQARTNKIYDATALDAADQLAASLMGNLTPAWSQWFGLKAGPDLSPSEADALAPVLEQVSRTIQAHFDSSNFAVEIHQCYLDLVVGGTASLSFEESEVGESSAFNFRAIALKNTILEEGASGYLDGSYTIYPMNLDQLSSRYPFAQIPSSILKQAAKDPQSRFDVLEAVLPKGLSYDYNAILIHDENEPVVLHSGSFSNSPIINFRWSKSPSEIYGRSPVMKALPDIKTANKVVELILKNASIAVTGIWQADDDGVLNPANIELTPGSIIPKAIGSKGLQPLEMPGRFDVSQLVLDNLQSRIRHALLADKLLPVANAGKMSATEVIERSAEMSLILGATYGRLQVELLNPLIKRAFSILRRRGEVPDILLDGRMVIVDYRSPLARAQGQRNVQNTLSWISSVMAMGSEASLSINLPETARFLGEAMAVPSDLIRSETILDLDKVKTITEETISNQ